MRRRSFSRKVLFVHRKYLKSSKQLLHVYKEKTENEAEFSEKFFN